MDPSVYERITRLEIGTGVIEYGVAGPTDAPVLLLLHAIRNTKMLFAGIVPSLAEQYRVIGIDLRGHGHSTVEAPYTFDQIVSDIAHMLDAERLDDVTIVGASFAAVPAQMLAVREPQRISRLILLDGGFYSLAKVPGFDLEAVVARLTAARFLSIQEAEQQFADRYGAECLPAGWMSGELLPKEDGSYGYRLAKEAFTGYFQEYAKQSTEELYQRLECPVLLLLADERLLPDDEQRLFYREAACNYQKAVRNVQVKTIPDSLHLLMVTHPRETVNEIKRFLQE
ncbi:alpha/beta fold hydrolase [Brevibacillus sp. NRS-1366]|uniref:alpha/beta fold hydrolase n=1 Tax=Brevibacillus sp. NRS-1366 TaxID=3233899 RepID=UPI003D1C8DE6